MKKALTLFFLLPLLAIAQQNQWVLNDSIAVSRYGRTLDMPWAGGIDYGQFSAIDINRDGLMDLFLFDRDNSRIIILVNDGSGSPHCFHDSTAKYAPVFPTQMHDVGAGWATLYDYNCDGLPDLFTLRNGNNGILQYLASYNGGWLFKAVDSTMTYQFGSNATTIYANNYITPCFYDVDGDGDMDIVLDELSSCPGAFDYYKNFSIEDSGGCGKLNDYKKMTSSWGQFALRTGPYDYTSVDTTRWGIVNCPPAPAPSERDDTYSQPMLIDLNGDGLTDMLIGDSGAKNVLAVINGGSIASDSMVAPQDTLFPTIIPNADTPAILRNFTTMYYVDVDNDGAKDMIVCNREWSDLHNVLYYQNIGTNNSPIFHYQHDSLFQSEMIDVGEAAGPVFFDADGDGLLDLIIAGTFKDSTNYPNPPFGTSYLTLYKNVGTATAPSFQFVTDDYAGVRAYNLQGPIYPTFGNLNGHSGGAQDMIVSDNNGVLLCFRNQQACSCAVAGFVFDSAFATNFNGTAPQIVDLDRDGLNDLIVGTQNGMINFYKNTGAATAPFFNSSPTNNFLGHVNVSTPNYVDGYAVPFVFDNGGHYNMLVASMQGAVFLYDSIDGNLGGQFRLVDTVLSKYYGNSFTGRNITVSGGDINGDGLMDMTLGLFTGGAQIYYNSSPLSVSQISKPEVSFTVYPNPASGMLNFNFNNLQKKEDYHLYILNAIGEVIYSAKVGLEKQSLSVADFASGLYLVRLQSAEQSVTTRVVIDKTGK